MAGPSNLKFDEVVLSRMSEGESLRSICSSLKEQGCPTEGRFRQRALADDPPGFATRYARARELQMDAWVEEILEIADDGRNDWMTIQRGGGAVQVVDQEALQRSRLRVDTRKWLMSKIAPKRYGDKVEQTIQGPDGGPVQLTWKLRSPTPPETKS